MIGIATKLGSKNRFTPEQTNKLKQHWTRVTVTVENRVRAAHILIKFHKVAKQVWNWVTPMLCLLFCMHFFHCSFTFFLLLF